MSTYINYDASNGILNGFNKVCEAVKLTMGYNGAYAIVENPTFGTFHPTKDGVTVAKSVYCENKVEQIGANLAKQVSAKQLLNCGDNTTTVLVLAQSIVNSDLNGVSVVDFIKGLKIAHEEAEKKLRELSKPVTDNDIKAIANVSANNDNTISDIIVEALSIVGKDGIIDLEKTNSINTTIKYVEGMKIERGYKNVMFVNNHSKGIVEYSDAYILLFEGHVDNLSLISPAINKSVKDDKPLLIVCDSISEDATDILLDNIERGALKACVIQSPEYGDKRKQLLSDLAVFTGTSVFVQGVTLDSDMPVGTAHKIVINADTTSIIQKERAPEVNKRVEELMSTDASDEFSKQRLANLIGGVATIFVGGQTQGEIDERFDRFDDSRNAVKSAVEQGFVAGGGSTFLHISNSLKQTFHNYHVQLGYDALKLALLAPFKTILANGYKDYNDYLTDLLEKEYGFGVDLKQGVISNLLEDSIIDSTKGLSSALTNAVSTSSIILNTKIVSVI